ncbi:MAG: transposase [Rhodospirillales bacterium]|nr:transposase [Rhodospirillales bacterium]
MDQRDDRGARCRADHSRPQQRQDAHAFSPVLYRLRNRVERFFNKLKQFRRIATRYETLAANYRAMIQIATIRIWLRANESTP